MFLFWVFYCNFYYKALCLGSCYINKVNIIQRCTLMHLLVWGERETTEEQLVGERHCLSVSVGEKERETAGYSERKRLWEWVSWSLDGGEDRGTMLGIYAGLMGPDSAEYTEGQQGSTLTFLFTQSAALCVRTVIDWWPVRGGSLPSTQCTLGKSPTSLN